MKRVFTIVCSIMLVISLSACSSYIDSPKSLETSASFAPRENSGKTDVARQIQITGDHGNVIVFALNESTAAKELYEQLPLSVTVENYSRNEKIFYPPEKLDTGNAPLAKGPAGTLAYYEPWGDVVMYYGDADGASGLYALGAAVSGTESISELTGEIRIEAMASTASSSELAKPERTSASQETSLTKGTSTPLRADSSETPRPPSSQASPVLRPSSSEQTSSTATEVTKVTKMKVQVGKNTFSATLAENAAADSFVKMMQNAPVVINMRDYSGFEKVGSLENSLPVNNRQTTTQSGDIVLYNRNQIVVFYGSNSWSYTRLGKIDKLSGWEKALGSGDITITFSLR